MKKSGMFIAPVVASFTLANVSVAASGGQFSDWANPPQIDN